MRILILGGCHTYAYGVENIENGYFQKILRELEIDDNISVTSYAPITIKNALNLILAKKIDLEMFDLIILQLGNHEFELGVSEFHKLFALKYLRKYDISGSKFTKELSNDLINERRSWYKPNTDHHLVTFAKKVYSYAAGFLFKLLDHVINYPRFIWYEKHIGEFFKEFDSVSSKVLCIGVFPCRYLFRQSLREKGDSLLKKFCMLRDIKYVDLVNTKLDESFFLTDGIHLSEKGHTFIFEKVFPVVEEITPQ